MRRIGITVPVASFSEELASMRKWLDKHAYHPRVFTPERHGNSLRITLEFNDDSEANHFEEAFNLSKSRQTDYPLLSPQLQWTIDFSGANAHMSTNTMARACWYRLMSEEVRAEADGFESPTAKETMRVVAETWDRLAESFERCLAGTAQP